MGERGDQSESSCTPPINRRLNISDQILVGAATGDTWTHFASEKEINERNIGLFMCLYQVAVGGGNF